MPKEKVKKIVWLNSLILCSSIYPIVFLYSKNVAEMRFEEISNIMLLYVLIGYAIWGGCAIILRQINKSALAAYIWICFLTNYMFLQKFVQMLLPNLKYWHIVPVSVYVITTLIYWINKKVKDRSLDSIIQIITIMVLALILINYVPAIPQIVKKTQEVKHTQAETIIAANRQQGCNIYWLIFDECASFPVIEKYYKDSDHTVYDYLLERSFTISDESRNECANTNVVLTNCLNLQYIANTGMDASEVNAYRKDPLLFTLLKQEGYTITGVGETAWLGVESISLDKGAASQTVEGYSPSDVILQNTIAAPFCGYDGTQSARRVLEAFRYMEDTTHFMPNSATFYMMYVCSPHQPFLFDENGGKVQAANYNNWADDKYYLGQYKYVMKELMKIVDGIEKNDPDAIIIVQSDHGPRFKEGIPYEDKINILNAVYYRGEVIDEIDGKSGVNTLRTILNRLFGYALEDLEVRDGE